MSLNERQCFIVLEPTTPPIIPMGGDLFVTVAPGEGVFVEGEQFAGNATEEWTVIVTAYSRSRLDSTDRDTKVLQDQTRGMLVLKGRVLSSLVGADLLIDGEPFLRTLLFAQQASRPGRDDENFISWVDIVFGVHFDWSW